MLFWRAVRGSWDIKRIKNPVFILVCAGWVLAFFSRRFWLDWGMPALCVWMARELDELIKHKIDAMSRKRLFLSLAVAASFYLSFTTDVNGRWTHNLTAEYLSPEDAGQKPWLPEAGGIVYAEDMRVFYQTFFRNPRAPWRYILGFEPTWMPPEDLGIFRKIQWNYGADESFEPWVRKMTPRDRLIIRRTRSGRPDIPSLEWHYAATGTWIGRLKE
jgi:hypothetical protein